VASVGRPLRHENTVLRSYFRKRKHMWVKLKLKGTAKMAWSYFHF